MNKYLRTFSIIAVLLLIFYLSFFLVAPKKIEKAIKKNLKAGNSIQIANLSISFDNLEVSAKPNLDIIVSADKISIAYPDKQDYLRIGSLKLEISSIPLLFKNLNIKHISGDKATINQIILISGEKKINNYLKVHLKQPFITKDLPLLKDYKFKIKSITLTNTQLITTTLINGQFKVENLPSYNIEEKKIYQFLNQYFTSNDKQKAFTLK